MTPEIENEQLRTRLAEMAAEVERLSHERQCLAEAIGRIAVASGDTRTEFTGPDLLMVCGDAAEGIKHLTAENARLQSVIDGANAQKSSFYLWQHKSGKFAHGFYECEEHAAGDWKSFSADGKAVPFYARPIPAHVIQKGFVLWPENLTFDMVAAYESAILCPISALSGEGYLRMLNVVKSQFNNPLRSASSPRITEQDALAIAESLEPFFDNITQSFDLPAWHGRVLWTLLDKLNGDKNAR